MSPTLDRVMVAPVSGSPVAFGLFHMRRVASTPILSGQPRERAVPQNRVDISAAGRQQATESAEEPAGEQTAAQSGETGLPPGALQEQETTAQRALESLRQRDQEVRLHEQAHLLAAGPYAKGAPSYTYQTGPDGQRYAVGGEVPIDLSAVPGNPQATLQKALTIRRAALAPADPSATDQAVAAQATTLAAQAQQDLLETQSLSHLTTTPHVCGPNCQSHGTALTPAANVPVAFTPLASATRALQTYQSAAQTLAA
jgi:SprA-related family